MNPSGRLYLRCYRIRPSGRAVERWRGACGQGRDRARGVGSRRPRRHAGRSRSSFALSHRRVGPVRGRRPVHGGRARCRHLAARSTGRRASALTWLVVWSFLAGGILDRYARNRPTRGRGFFGACGAHFPAMLRLGRRRVADLARGVARSIGDRRAGSVAIVAGLAAGLVFLYARVRLVVEDRRSAIGALLAGGRFIRRNPGAVPMFLIFAAAVWSVDLAVGTAGPRPERGRAAAVRGVGTARHAPTLRRLRVVGVGDRRSSRRGWRMRRILRVHRSSGRNRRPRKRSRICPHRRSHDVPRLPERAHPHRRRRGREHRDPPADPDARGLHAPRDHQRLARSDGAATSSTGPT